MLIKKYNVGDEVSYNGGVYKIVEETFKVDNIADIEKQIKIDLTSEYGDKVSTNIWKSDLNKNPNIFFDKDENKYKLAEIEVGSKVKFVGFRYDYNGNTQFNSLGGYQLVEDQGEMEYKANLDVNKLTGMITQLLNHISSEPIKQTCLRIYKDYYDDFICKPAASSHHHAYVGGLLQHTTEVMVTAYNMSQPYKVDTDHIIAASFCHDITKVKEYSIDGKWQDFGNKIGHVVGSANIFNDYAKIYEVSDKDIYEICHCILAHHGKPEWGSPVKPSSPEAVIVHEADMISAGLNPIFTISTYETKDYYLK